MGEGERVNKITNLQDDIALSLAAKSVRIFAPIPGTSLVGIEIPNATTQPVYLAMSCHMLRVDPWRLRLDVTQKATLCCRYCKSAALVGGRYYWLR